MSWHSFLRGGVRPHIVILVLISVLFIHGLSERMPLAGAAQVVTTNDEVISRLPKVLSAISERRMVEGVNCQKVSCVALTFDDGPDPALTPQILDILARHNALVTFFVQGYMVARHPEIIKRAVDDGHEIANHSWSHLDFKKLTDLEMQGQVNDTDAAVVAAGGRAPKYFRPPYGYRDDRIRAAVGKPLIIWNVDPQDWRPSDKPEALTEAVVAHIQPGSIVLMHDTKPVTVGALDSIITRLKTAQYNLVTVDQMLDLPAGARGDYASQIR